MLTLKPQILILADESVEDSIVHSDSRSLATLLLIRDIQVSLDTVQ
jgi:ion channel POLLUX/CASTOR